MESKIISLFNKKQSDCLMHKSFSLCILLVVLLTGCAQNTTTPDDSIPLSIELTPLIQLELGLSFPPVNNADQREFTEEQLEALSVRLVRFAENWRNREPEPGRYNWTPLDGRLDWVQENRVSLLLTIQSNGPDWACDPDYRNERSCVYLDQQDFSNYVHALLQRYPNQIDKIQFGNEWMSQYWYAGSAQDFVRFHNILYEAVQTHSPHTLVVLGGFSYGTLKVMAFCEGYLDTYEAIRGGQVIELNRNECETSEAHAIRERILFVLENAFYDLLDFHFYDDVENWPIILDVSQELFPTESPIIVSEFGGPNLFWELPYSDEFQAERLVEYIQTLDLMGIEEAYFFKLVQSDSASPAHRQSGLFMVDNGVLIPKPAYEVFLAFSSEIGD